MWWWCAEVGGRCRSGGRCSCEHERRRWHQRHARREVAQGEGRRTRLAAYAVMSERRTATVRSSNHATWVATKVRPAATVRAGRPASLLICSACKDTCSCRFRKRRRRLAHTWVFAQCEGRHGGKLQRVKACEKAETRDCVAASPCFSAPLSQRAGRPPRPSEKWRSRRPTTHLRAAPNLWPTAAPTRYSGGRRLSRSRSGLPRGCVRGAPCRCRERTATRVRRVGVGNALRRESDAVTSRA